MDVMLSSDSLVAQGRTAEVYAWRDGQVLKLFHAWCPPAWIEQVPQLPPELKAGALRVLDELPDGTALCHFDFHPDQVLLTARGPVVIDWMTALQGDPLADVARTAIILHTGRLPYGSWSRRAFVGLWRGLFRRAYLTHYRELHAEAAFEWVGSWMAPVAAARLYEGIAGESEALLRILRSVLLARIAAPVLNETGPTTRRRR